MITKRIYLIDAENNSLYKTEQLDFINENIFLENTVAANLESYGSKIAFISNSSQLGEHPLPTHIADLFTAYPRRQRLRQRDC